MKDIVIVIPARYASTRLPGKPLIKIAGKEMIRRVAEIAASVCKKKENQCTYVVATDDERIVSFCESYTIPVVLTDEACKNGTERCWNALQRLSWKPKLIINLQGDNPLCPPWIIQDLIDAWRTSQADVYTPAVQLDWQAYDNLVLSKQVTPHSGTTVLVDYKNNALAFSKNIIPAIRNKEKAAANNSFSPVRRHIGLYAYIYETLEHYHQMQTSPYESNAVEGLEQMRFLYNGLKVRVVDVDYRNRETTSGVDSPEDIVRVETILSKYGEYEL